MTNVVQQFDLELYIQKYGATPTQPDEWVLLCPLCGKDKLIVNTSKGTWHCWVCEDYKVDYSGRRVAIQGAGGVLKLIQLLEKCSREQATGILVAGSGFQTVPVESVEDNLVDTAEQQSVIRVLPEIPAPPGWKSITVYDNLTYLNYRGISEADVKSFGLVYCDSGRYAGRLIFPVFENGRLIYYQARAMWDDKDNPQFRKSLNPIKMDGMAGPTEVLMNLDTAKHYPRVVITEGPIDCIHAGPASVPTLGKKMSMIQILKLIRAGVKALDMMWDGPTDREPLGAWPEMIKLAPTLLGLFDDVRLVFLPRGDPGNYNREQLDAFREQAMPAQYVSGLCSL